MRAILAKSTELLGEQLHTALDPQVWGALEGSIPLYILSLPSSPLLRGKRGQRAQRGLLFTPFLPIHYKQALEEDGLTGV